MEDKKVKRQALTRIASKLDNFCYVMDINEGALINVEFKSSMHIDELTDKVHINFYNSLNTDRLQLELTLEDINAFCNSGDRALDVIKRLNQLKEDAKKRLPQGYKLLGDLFWEASCVGKKDGITVFSVFKRAKPCRLFLYSSPCPLPGVYTEPYLTINKEVEGYGCNFKMQEGKYELLFYTDKDAYSFQAEYINGGFKLMRKFNVLVDFKVNIKYSNSPDLTDYFMRDGIHCNYIATYYEYLD